MDNYKSELFEKLRKSRDLSDFVVRETAMDIYSEAFDILFERIKELRKYLTISVAKECKCERNIAVNMDMTKRNIELRERLNER